MQGLALGNVVVYGGILRADPQPINVNSERGQSMGQSTIPDRLTICASISRWIFLIPSCPTAGSHSPLVLLKVALRSGLVIPSCCDAWISPSCIEPSPSCAIRSRRSLPPVT
jgi:hypothetical protein